MIKLPKIRCPQCGKYMTEAKAREIPPAITYRDCLRRCPACRIGASNAKNPAKIKFIHAQPKDQTPPAPPAPPEQPAQ